MVSLIAQTWAIPLFYAVVDGSLAGRNTQDQPALLVGQILSSGTATVDIPTPIGSLSQAKSLFGPGSMLERMAAAFFAANTTQELWALPLADPTSGIAAKGSVTIATPATASGNLYLYVAGQLVTSVVYTTDTTAGAAIRLRNAINAVSTLPVTATVDGTNLSKVNLTCKWLGDTGNDIQFGFNLLGTFGGQAYPVGVTTTMVPMAGGTGQPNFANSIANIAAQQFYHVAMPYADTASQTQWSAEFAFTSGGRWDYTRAQFGWVYNALRYDYTTALARGAVLNSPVISSMIMEPTMPSPVWEVTASYCGVGAAALLIDPARPLQTLELPGIIPAPIQDRFTSSELNTLTNNGFAIMGASRSGAMIILREALQYQFNAYGQRDTAFGLLTILSNLAAIIERLRNAITSKYPRHKLAPDGTKFGAGQAIVTPLILKGELISEAKSAVFDGLMTNIEDFITGLIVMIDDQSPNRVNVIWPPQLMAGLRQFVVDAQFRLQADNN